MIENIDRHIEMRKPLEDAIINAANEIVVPTLVATLAIAIVWLPLFRLTGSENTANAVRAAIEAGKTRFCAVLMTASAMILGMVPMATGYSQNAPLGRAVIGGLLVATVFTLSFVPCVYAIIYSRRTAEQKGFASR